jgi:SAM-dependent methyltransferase
MGYSNQEIASVPESSLVGLGCGNPTALAGLREGETVLDIGFGAGLDAFLVSRKVGQKGKVIGVDVTTEMVERARRAARTLTHIIGTRLKVGLHRFSLPSSDSNRSFHKPIAQLRVSARAGAGSSDPGR